MDGGPLELASGAEEAWRCLDQRGAELPALVTLGNEDHPGPTDAVPGGPSAREWPPSLTLLTPRPGDPSGEARRPTTKDTNRLGPSLRQEAEEAEWRETERAGARCRPGRDLDEASWFGAASDLVEDCNVSELYVLGPRTLRYIRNGKDEIREDVFESGEQLERLCRVWLTREGIPYRKDQADYRFHAASGRRVHMLFPPLACGGPFVSVRNHFFHVPSREELVDWRVVAEGTARDICRAGRRGLNVVVSGPLGAGKSKILGAFLEELTWGDRLVTVELDPQLLSFREPRLAFGTLRGPHTGCRADHVAAILRLASSAGSQVIVDPCGPSESAAVIGRMWTGGVTWLTVSAHSPEGALRRLAAWSGRPAPGPGLLDPLIAESIDLVVHVDREVSNVLTITGGQRVTRLASPVRCPTDGGWHLEDIERWVPRGRDEEGRCVGDFQRTGFLPEVLGPDS